MDKSASVSTLRVVTTPTIGRLMKFARNCRSRILITSPFVNEGILDVAEVVRPSVRRTIITRTDVRHFALGSSDVASLLELGRRGFRVRALPGLHAKVYIFDTSAALVTSANATRAGLYHNRECGLETTDAGVVRQLASAVLSGLGASAPPRLLSRVEVEALEAEVAALKAAAPESLERARTDAAGEVQPVVAISDSGRLLDGYQGWTRLVLRGVLGMRFARFSLDELMVVCRPEAARMYPRNRHVREKVRQQLQRLRYRELVEFLGDGRYRRTVAARSEVSNPAS